MEMQEEIVRAYSPKGNLEVWRAGTVPEGYFTEEEWLELHPPEPPDPAMVIRREIEWQKQILSGTDYKIIKCSEYELNGLDMPYDVAELHNERQAARDRINELEAELAELE